MRLRVVFAPDSVCGPTACYYQTKMSAEPANIRTNLLGKSADELRAFMQSIGEPAYRGGQLYHALYAERRSDLTAISNLPAGLRQKLSNETSIDLPRIVRRHHSEDGTVRYV